MEGPNIIDLLLGEHAAILTVLNHVEIHAPGWNRTRLKDAAADLEALMARHASLEDALLFDLVDSSNTGVKQTLAALRGEHQEMWDLLAKAQGAKDSEDSRSLLAQLVEKAREHFAVEERVLFPIASKGVGRTRLVQLGAEWARRRGLSLS